MIEANCQTTAMGIMPFTDAEKALELALSLDIPFWPQLPRAGFHQDMYAQTASGFPGISIDIEDRKISFSTARFHRELPRYSLDLAEEETFALSGVFAAVYRCFLEQKLGSYPAIRGQVAGPVSLGFNVLDESRRPIVYNDEVRTLLIDFIRRKVELQQRQLKSRNPNAFVWIDDPALANTFSSIYGYSDRQAKEDYSSLLQIIPPPRGLHLCTNVNLPFLLELGVDILSFDAYQLGLMPAEYAAAAAAFLRKGGVICWGIVPTDTEALSKESPGNLYQRLLDYWGVISGHGITLEKVAQQALLAPAKCCVKDFWRSRLAADKRDDCASPDIEAQAVEKAFGYLKLVSASLRERFQI